MVLEKGCRVGVIVVESDKKGVLRKLPPRRFGEVVEVSADGESCYVDLEEDPERPDGRGFSGKPRRDRVYFHASELEIIHPPKKDPDHG
jgi:hypothetical protein